MKQLANLFLILFLVAASLGIGTELLNPYWPDNPIAELRDMADLLAVLLALLIYFGLGFNRHLPKLIFVSLLTYRFWGLLDSWPLEPLIGDKYQLVAACGQLLLGFLALKLIQHSNGKSLLLVRSQFAGPGFSGGNFFRFCLLSIPLLPVVLLLLSYSAAGSLIEEYTAGFVRLKPNGLYMIEKIYVQGDKQIRLVSMIHMGRQDYYQELSDSFNAGHTLLLAEGISDTKGLLSDTFSYGKLADLLGLTSQEQLSFPGRLIEAEQLGQPNPDGTGTPDILRADIDLQEFDPRTIEVLNAIGRYLLNSRSLRSGYQEFSDWAAQNVTPEINRIVMDDLLQKRNRAVLSYLPKGLQNYRTLVIPWGALHMPGIETAVKQRGFVLQDSRERLSIDFLTLPYEQLWENLTGAAGKKPTKPPPHSPRPDSRSTSKPAG